MRNVLLTVLAAGLLGACALPREAPKPAPLRPQVTVAREELMRTLQSGDTAQLPRLVHPAVVVTAGAEERVGQRNAFDLARRAGAALGSTPVRLEVRQTDDCRTAFTERALLRDADNDSLIQTLDMRWILSGDGVQLERVLVLPRTGRPPRAWRCSSSFDELGEMSSAMRVQSRRSLRLAVYPAQSVLGGRHGDHLRDEIVAAGWDHDGYVESHLDRYYADAPPLLIEGSRRVAGSWALRAHALTGSEVARGGNRRPLELSLFRASSNQGGVSAEWRSTYLRLGAGGLVQRSVLRRELKYLEDTTWEESALLLGATAYAGMTLPVVRDLSLEFLAHRDQVQPHDARFDDGANLKLDWSSTSLRMGLSWSMGGLRP